MATEFVIQSLTSRSGVGSLPAELAVDVGAYDYVTVQVVVPTNATGVSTLIVEHASRRDQDFFEPITGATVDLTADAVKTITIAHPNRYVRWNISALGGGTPKFLINALGR